MTDNEVWTRERLKKELLKMRSSIDSHIDNIDKGGSALYVVSADLSVNLTHIIFICNDLAIQEGIKR